MQLELFTSESQLQSMCLGKKEIFVEHNTELILPELTFFLVAARTCNGPNNVIEKFKRNMEQNISTGLQ